MLERIASGIADLLWSVAWRLDEWVERRRPAQLPYAWGETEPLTEDDPAPLQSQEEQG